MNGFRHLRFGLGLMIILAVFGTIGFMIFESMTFFDAFWLTIITVLTVGYGDTIPVTFAGKVFALLIIPISIGIVTYVIGSITALIIEGELSLAVRRRKMEKEIEKLSGHIIVCGLGRVGEQVMQYLQDKQIPAVFIDQNEEIITQLTFKKGNYVIGDATNDEILIKAGIKRASGLITTLPRDAENVFITLSAKELNPSLTIVTRAEKNESKDKLIKAGADKVITPHSISGKQMVLSILKPKSVDYVDMMLQVGKQEYGFEEIYLGSLSPIISKKIKEADIRKKYGITVIAVIKGDQFISNPSADVELETNDRLIVFGSSEQLQSFEQAVKDDSEG
ncbi:potassium channel family protein [Bacillus alveayuensis]|uniref:potassium channel family protein n=1 Tax=Aeribacillus alveayuensis TaxID=279215 RepID=UPI0005CD686B|nr:potassium channel protein [Bacillus alveayuensis]